MGQNAQKDKATKALYEAIALKPNYRDPRYAIAVYKNEEAIDEADPAKKQELIQEAITQLEYVLSNINPTDTQSQELLDSLKQN